MRSHAFPALSFHPVQLAGALALAALLAACGGSAAPDTAAAAATPMAAPYFHLAPLDGIEPDQADLDGSGSSAQQTPQRHQALRGFEQVNDAGLDAATLQAWQNGARSASALAAVKPSASTTTYTVYTPAQIRAAYTLPAMPSATALKTAAGKAALGAGQTIYIVGAHDNPTVQSDLAAFNTKFGLPACTSAPVASSAALPLAAASADAGCTISVVYSTAAGALMSSKAPTYDAGWASESALDTQWAHATAPLARIVVIEAPDTSVDSLMRAVSLANAMGPGVVSMSFGTPEGSWSAGYESNFKGKNMLYLAATGDSGSGVSWPASSALVLAVGGTTLSYDASGTRTETAWSQTGGGVSAYVTRPGYQSAIKITNALTGASAAPLRRAVADVAFNADPHTGQYVALTVAGAKTPSWFSYGGTSIATPQWAGLLTLANASRALAGKTVLGSAHTPLYTAVAAVPGTYAAAFIDIRSGSDGNCATCAAATGYDLLTGLGAPRAANLLTALNAY